MSENKALLERLNALERATGRSVLPSGTASQGVSVTIVFGISVMLCEMLCDVVCRGTKVLAKTTPLSSTPSGTVLYTHVNVCLLC